MARDVNILGCKTIVAALETPVTLPRLLEAQFSQLTVASSNTPSFASAAALQRRPQHVRAVGSLQLLRKD